MSTNSSEDAQLGSSNALQYLRVTTWNILAPVIDVSQMFPGVDKTITSQEARREVIREHLASFDSDVIFLQEVRPCELSLLLELGLGDIYEHYIALEKRGLLHKLRPASQTVNTALDPIEQRAVRRNRSLTWPTQASADRAPRYRSLTCHSPRALGDIGKSLGLIIYGGGSDDFTADYGAVPESDRFLGLEAGEEAGETNCHGEIDQQRGVAILWRRNLLSDVQSFEEPGDTLNPAAFVHGVISGSNIKVFLGTKHLDALGCPPSVEESQKQLLQMTDAITRSIESGNVAVVCGGDCNFSNSAPAFEAMERQGFVVASGHSWVPTCFSLICSARLDHLFARGPLQISDSDIPICPFHHCCTLLPCFYRIQVMTDIVRDSLTKRRELSCSRCLLGYILAIPLLIVIIIFFLIPIPLSFRRCRWALKEYGSDHLPVSVTFKIELQS